MGLPSRFRAHLPPLGLLADEIANLRNSLIIKYVDYSRLPKRRRRKSWKKGFLGSQHFFLRTITAQFVDSIAPAATHRYP
jgi:hypothetical protein